jgi:hypothetical protein
VSGSIGFESEGRAKTLCNKATVAELTPSVCQLRTHPAARPAAAKHLGRATERYAAAGLFVSQITDRGSSSETSQGHSPMRRCNFLSRLPRYIGKKAVLQFIILRTLREPDRRRRYEERLSRSKQRTSNFGSACGWDVRRDGSAANRRSVGFFLSNGKQSGPRSAGKGSPYGIGSGLSR